MAAQHLAHQAEEVVLAAVMERRPVQEAVAEQEAVTLRYWGVAVAPATAVRGAAVRVAVRGCVWGWGS